MKKSIVITTNIILILLTLALGGIYNGIGGLAIKGSASFCFVLVGLANLFFAYKSKTLNKKFCIIMVIGLTFAMLGDILLNIEFIIGAALFAIGHVFYFIAYCNVLKFKPTDLIAGAVIFIPAALFILLAPFFNFEGSLMLIVCLVYALIISLMVGKAIANLIRQQNLLNIILVVGSVLFFISDLMLLLNVFGGLPEITDILCLATYYPAECFLAFAVLISTGNFAQQNQTQQNLNQN